MVRGTCLCGGIEFEVEEVPLLTNCHCSKCRKARGAAFNTTASVSPPKFRFLRGEDLLEVFQQPSGRYSTAFCRTCGSAAPFKSGDGRIYFIPAGLLDDDPGVRPALHLFVGSKAPWWEITDNLTQFEEWVPGFGPGDSK